MTDDILDAAQKAINDAAAGSAAGQSVSPPPEPPPEPAPVPVVEPAVPAVPPATNQPVQPAGAAPADPKLTKEQMLEALMHEGTVAKPPETPIIAAIPTAPGSGYKPKKKSKAGIIAVIVTLLLALPVGVYFIAQRDEQVADTRGRAWGTGYQQCTIGPGQGDQGSCGPGFVCHCQDGDMCTETACEPDDGTKASCERQGREWCVNQHGYAMTCCYPGYVCCTNEDGCCGGGNTPKPPTEPPEDNTPTDSPNPICLNIKVYKAGAVVSDLTTLRPGDDVVFAVKGNLTPTKAHFRVNGQQIPGDTDGEAGWTVTTTKNASDEWTLPYTIPDGVTDFQIEGEVFTNGAYR